MNQMPRPDSHILLQPNITLKGHKTDFYVYPFFTDLHSELWLRTLCVCVYMYVYTSVNMCVCLCVYVSADKLTAVLEI